MSGHGGAQDELSQALVGARRGAQLVARAQAWSSPHAIQ